MASLLIIEIKRQVNMMPYMSTAKPGSILICTCAFKSLSVQLFTSLSFKLIMACKHDYWNGKTATNSPLSMQLEYVFEKFEEYLSCSKENLTSIFITSMTTKQQILLLHLDIKLIEM